MKKNTLRTILLCITFISFCLFLFTLVLAFEYVYFQAAALGIFIINLIVAFIIDRHFFIKMYQNIKNVPSFKVVTKLLYAVVILFIVNYTASFIPVQFDLTTTKLHTLSSSSLSFLKTLSSPVNITVFANGASRDQFSKFFKLYSNENSNIEVSFVDPLWRPDLVSKFSITKIPAVAIEANKRSAIVNHLDEVRFSSALIRMFNEPPSVAIIDDLSEVSFGTDQTGLSTFVDQLNKSEVELHRIRISELNSNSTIKLALILGIRPEIRDSELRNIMDFVKSGGSLFISVDPFLNKAVGKNVQKLLRQFSIGLDKGIIIDKNRSVEGSKGMAPFAATKIDHPITKNLEVSDLQTLFFPMAPGFKILGNNAKGLIYSSSFVSKNNGSYLESDPMSVLGNGNLKNSSTIQAGPYPFMVVSSIESSGKLVLWASSSALSNAYIPYSRNLELVFSSIHWLTTDYNLVGIDYLYKDKIISITGSKLDLLLYVLTIVIPLIFILIALIVRYFRGRIA